MHLSTLAVLRFSLSDINLIQAVFIDALTLMQIGNLRMRITGGIHKNRKIITQNKANLKVSYRPTAERTRLAVFNILQHSSVLPPELIEDAIVADVFCGCGSFGLEAISRGAKKVFFIDQSPEQLEMVKFNLENIKEFSKHTMLRYDATLIPKANVKCNLVYIDPPYQAVKITERVLKGMIKNDWLEVGCVVIVELNRDTEFELPNTFIKLDERVYGKTKIVFCEYVAIKREAEVIVESVDSEVVSDTKSEI